MSKNESNKNLKATVPSVAAPPAAGEMKIEAQAPMTVEPTVEPPVEPKVEPTAEQRMESERALLVATVETTKVSIATSLAAGDYAAVGTGAATIASLNAKISALDIALVSRRFAPTIGEAVRGLIAAGLAIPQVAGKLVVQLTFEAGALTCADPIFVGFSPSKVDSASPVSTVAARANLRHATLDPRLPGAGWSRKFTSKGNEWTLTITGSGQCRAVCGSQTLEGTLNGVCLTATGNSVNVYALLGLGPVGTVWNDAAPSAGWTKA